MAQTKQQAPHQAPRQRRRHGRGARPHRPQARPSEERKAAAKGSAADAARRPAGPAADLAQRDQPRRVRVRPALRLHVVGLRHGARDRRLARARASSLSLHPARLLHRPVRLPPPASSAKRGNEALPWTSACSPSGPVQENCFLVRRDGADRGARRRPGRRGRAPPRGRSRSSGVDRRGDPAHPHALRPRRRRRAGRRAHGRARLLPAASRPTSSPTSWPTSRGRASGRSRATTPTTWSRAASASSSPGFDIDVLFTPGHCPGHVTYSIADEQALFSGDVLFQGSIGRTDLPGGDWPTLLRVDRRAARRAARRDARCCPGHMGLTTLGRERATNPFLRELARRCEPRLQAPRGTFDVLPATRRSRAPRSSARRARSSRRAGYGRIETPTFEATELFARGVGESTDIVQKEMYTLRGRRRAVADAAPRGHRAGLPRLPRARDAQAPAAREALVPLELLPPRAPAGRPLPPVLAGRGGGDRLRRPRRRRRVDPPARRPARRARRRGRAPADRLASARPATRAAYREELQAYLRAHEAELSDGGRASASSSTRCAPSTPTTPAPGGSWRDAPRLLDRLDAEDREHFADGARAARRRRASPTRSTRRSCAAWTTTRARVFEFTSDALGAQSRRRRRRPLRRPGRAARRAADARLGWAAGVERMLLAAAPPPVGAAARRPLRRLRGRRGRAAGVPARRRRPPRGPARAARARRALAQGPAQAGRPAAAPGTLPSSAGTSGRRGAQGHGVGRAAHGGHATTVMHHIRGGIL